MHGPRPSSFFLVMAYLAGPLRRHRLKGEGEHEACEGGDWGAQAASARVLHFSLSLSLSLCLSLWLRSRSLSPSSSPAQWRSAWGPGRVSQRLQAHAHRPLKKQPPPSSAAFAWVAFPRRCNTLQCTVAVHCILKCCARQFPKQGLIDWGTWF